MLLLRLLTSAVLVVAASGCTVPSLLIRPVSSSPELQEVVVARGVGRDKVAVIEVEGLLLNATTGGGLIGAQENKVSLFRQQLERAAADTRVRAVVLRVNSPGGTVSASEVMYGDVMKFRQATGKPVVAACQDVAASGGYYVAVAADEIHATPTSVIGSIGVIFNTFDASELLRKVGLRVDAVTSGPNKDLGSPFKALSQDDRQILQGIVDELYGQFTGVVTSRRAITDAGAAFDGRVVTGADAVTLGLVDGIMDLDASILRAAALAGVQRPRVVMYKRPYGYRGTIYASSPVGGTDAGVAEAVEAFKGLTRAVAPGAYYVWLP